MIHGGRDVRLRSLGTCETLEVLVNVGLVKPEVAAELTEAYGHNIAVGLGNIQQTLAPGVFVLHGDPCGGGERLRAIIGAAILMATIAFTAQRYFEYQALQEPTPASMAHP